MIEAIIIKGTGDYRNILSKIRNKVFGSTECYHSDYFVEKDESSYHVVVYENNIPIATGRLVRNGNYFIDGVCVLEEFRRMSVGDLVVKMLIDHAFNEFEQSVYVLPVLNSEEFFMKVGFVLDVNNLEKYNLYRIQKSDVKRCKQ